MVKAVDRMDKYEVGGTLGQGQWGVVRKATRKSDGAEVAIKKVRCASGSAEGVNFQVLREIKMLRDVRHAHVVQLHDARLPGVPSFSSRRGDPSSGLVR